MSDLEEHTSARTVKHISKKRKLEDNKTEVINHDDDGDDNSDSNVSDDDEPTMTKKKRAVNEFILDEAEVADDDEDDSDSDEFDPEFIDDGEILNGGSDDDDKDEEKEEKEEEEDDEIDGDNDNDDVSGDRIGIGKERQENKRQRGIWDGNENEILEYIAERYSGSGAHEGTRPSMDTAPMTERGLDSLPTAEDPRLWLVKCRIGLEVETVLLLARKCLTAEKPYKVTSVFLPEGQKGWIYVEARDERHVRELMRGVGALAYGNETLKYISREEMPMIMGASSCASRRGQGFKRRQLVRMTRGPYKNDLAEVVSFDEPSNSVTVKLVPRIDYSRKRGQPGCTERGSFGPKRPFARVPQRAFDVKAIEDLGGRIRDAGEFKIFEGNRYKDGLLYKKFQADFIRAEGVQPTTMELRKLDREDEIKRINRDPDFTVGDKVVIARGPMKGTEGKIVGTIGMMFTVKSTTGAMAEPMTFKERDMRKYFRVGDHVKVTNGMYKDETGTVVKCDRDDDVITLISDAGMKEVKVFAKDSRESVEVNAPAKPDGAKMWSRQRGAGAAAGTRSAFGRSGADGRLDGARKNFYGANKHPLLGKTVRVVGGPFKASIGTVRSVNGEVARFLFHTNAREVSFNVGMLAPIEEPGRAACGSTTTSGGADKRRSRLIETWRSNFAKRKR